MLSLAVGLTFASYATAQVLSVIPMPVVSSSYGSASSSSPMAAPPAYTMPPSASGSSGYAPPAQYTPPPQTQAMPYESFTAGGYMTMQCGYGYQKGSDGSCTSTMSWVRNITLETSSAMRLTRFAYIQMSTTGCYQSYQTSVPPYDGAVDQTHSYFFAVVLRNRR